MFYGPFLAFQVAQKLELSSLVEWSFHLERESGQMSYQGLRPPPTPSVSGIERLLPSNSSSESESPTIPSCPGRRESLSPGLNATAIGEFGWKEMVGEIWDSGEEMRKREGE